MEQQWFAVPQILIWKCCGSHKKCNAVLPRSLFYGTPLHSPTALSWCSSTFRVQISLILSHFFAHSRSLSVTLIGPKPLFSNLQHAWKILVTRGAVQREQFRSLHNTVLHLKITSFLCWCQSVSRLWPRVKLTYMHDSWLTVIFGQLHGWTL